MILIAASLYLPHHVSFLTKRAWFYYHGDEHETATTAMKTASAVSGSLASAVTAAVEASKRAVLAAEKVTSIGMESVAMASKGEL